MQLAPLRPRRRRGSLDPALRATVAPVQKPADLPAIATRIAGLIDGPVSEALVVMLTELYGDALARTIAAIDASADSAAIIERLCADPLVGGLLVVHDLHPQSLSMRVAGALATFQLRSGLPPILLDRIEDDVVYLRFVAGLAPAERSAIARTIATVAPEITRVCVEAGAASELARPA